MRFDYNPPMAYLDASVARKRANLMLACFISLCIAIAFKNSNKTGYTKSIELPLVVSSLTAPFETSKEHSALSLHAIKADDKLVPIANNKYSKNKKSTKTSTPTPMANLESLSITIRAGDTMSQLFARHDLPAGELQKIVSLYPVKNQLSKLQAGEVVNIVVDKKQRQIIELKYPVSATKVLSVRNEHGQYKCSYLEREIKRKLRYSSSTVGSSLFASAEAVGLTPKAIMQLANIFAWDIDFNLDLREHDKFNVVFEERQLEDGTKEIGNIIAAEFIIKGKSYKAVRYNHKDGHSSYFTPDGYSLQKAFLRSPVKFTRISSKFTHGRFHPILHKIRAHRGVDYAAALGTPVEAAGNGKIKFIGQKNGYGNVIEIQHHRYTTLYAHLHKFAKNLQVGSIVKQGQVIAFVGRSGLATAPHLHYEFKIDGKHHDPLTVQLPRSLPIDPIERPHFYKQAKEALSFLEQSKINEHKKSAH